ncbi:MAG: 4Fe-4S binding protein, partial [Deltaproteobacteria bacterium]|nr:4Fe-4S binding protein [Deltaproteobacteria bacterium]
IYKGTVRLETDLDFCKGCGICAHECPTHAIEMVREEEAEEASSK